MSSPAHIHVDVMKHHSWLRSVIRARVSDAGVADDILGSVTADALALGERWQEIQKPGPWLYRVTIRKVFQYRRQQLRDRRLRSRLEAEGSAGLRQVQTTTPLDFLIAKERNELVRLAMTQVPGKYQEILILKYVHHWNYEEISRTLGINKTKVAHRLRNARNRLRFYLEKVIHDEPPHG